MPLTNVILLKSLLGAMGGLEKYTIHMAKAFQRAGCSVTILTSTSKKRALPNLEGINIIAVAKEGPFSFINLSRFAKNCQHYLKQHQSPIIFSLDRNYHQTHFRAGNGVHRSYLEKRSREEGFFKKISFIFNPLHRLILKYEKNTFEDPSLKTLFTNSFLVKNEILSFYHTDPKIIEVVHNGVEWDEMQPYFDKSTFNDSSKAQLLFVGHGYKRKGLDLLLYALKEVKGDFQLKVVGKDKNEAHFKKLAQKLGLEQKVLFYGPQKNIFPFYQEADSLVLPTTYDPFANVSLEALAMGLYHLTTKLNGASEIMNAQTGFIVDDPYDKKSLIDYLEKLIHLRKTKASAQLLRQLVKSYNFTIQLQKMIDTTLCPTQDII